MKFTDLKQDTPRLVVMYSRSPDGGDLYQWGMVPPSGGIPMLTLVGTIIRVQAELPMLEPSDMRFDSTQAALVIAWVNVAKSGEPVKMKCDWFVCPSIPVDSLVGMLETIKAAIIGSRQARQAASQQVCLVGPDGQPMRR